MAFRQQPPIFLLPLLLLLHTAWWANAEPLDSATRTNITLFSVLGIAFLVSILLAAWFCRSADRRRVPTTTTTNTTTIDDDKNQLGLDESIVASFPTLKYKSVRRLRTAHGPLECAVCLNEFTDRENLRLIPGCCHVFHTQCIETWLACHVTCPVCRANLADPAVIANDRCLVGGAEDVQDDVEDTGDGKKGKQLELEVFRRSRSTVVAVDRYTLRLPESVMAEIRRSASVNEGREGGRWVEFFRTMSSRRRRSADRVVPVFAEPNSSAAEANIDGPDRV